MKIRNGPALAWEDVTLSFDGRTVLAEFGLEAPAGSRTALRGPSGCGKSSLLMTALGFLEPARGAVWVAGRRVTPGEAWEIRRSIAWLPQEPALGDGSGAEVLTRPFTFETNRARLPARARLAEAVEELGLPAQRLEQAVDRYSGGEKQRLAVARALLLERPILLLDEPTSALDPDSILLLKEALSRRPGLTVLAATHEPERLDCWDRLVDVRSASEQGEKGGFR